MRGAILVGAVGATAALPAVASAQTISVPGFGNFEVPDLPQNIQQNIHDIAAAPQVQQMLHQAPAPVQQAVDQVANPQALAARVSGPTMEFGTTKGQVALDAARTQIGTPYVWGGQAPGGFDCSGLVKWAYANAGIQMPRTAFEQAHVGAPVPMNDIRPGDVIVYNGGEHAALYAGNGQILQAQTFGEPVKYSPVHDGGHIYTIRRL